VATSCGDLVVSPANDAARVYEEAASLGVMEQDATPEELVLAVQVWVPLRVKRTGSPATAAPVVVVVSTAETVEGTEYAPLPGLTTRVVARTVGGGAPTVTLADALEAP